MRNLHKASILSNIVGGYETTELFVSNYAPKCKALAIFLRLLEKKQANTRKRNNKVSFVVLSCEDFDC